MNEIEPMDETSPALEATPVATPVAAPVETGHPAVDQVLAAVSDLDARPVAEHVAVFEDAHKALREALTGGGQPVPAPGQATPSSLAPAPAPPAPPPGPRPGPR